MRRISVSAKYDPACDPTTWDGYNPTKMPPPPQWRSELWHHKGVHAAAAKANAKRPLAARERREAAEQRLADLVRTVVSALEFNMSELMEIGAVSGAKSHINQLQIHNALVLLKTKCGVKFSQEEFDPYRRKVILDREHT